MTNQKFIIVIIQIDNYYYTILVDVIPTSYYTMYTKKFFYIIV